MIKILLTILTLCLIILGFFYYKAPGRFREIKNIFYYEPCSEVSSYYIAILDARFNVPEKDFKGYIAEAANLWSTAYGKELFHYDPNGAMAVSLIYSRKNTLRRQIGWTPEDEKKGTWAQQRATYGTKMEEFQTKLKNFNQKIKTWEASNKQDTQLFLQLIAEKQLLEEEQLELKEWTANLNMPKRDTAQFNTQLNTAYQSMSNDQITTPEEGVYNPNLRRVNIFYYNDREEIVHTLAHELGHSLGMEHNKNPNSIMYYQANDTIELTPEDIAELKRVCKPRTFQDNVQFLFEKIPNLWGDEAELQNQKPY
jgi:hypothetical protein